MQAKSPSRPTILYLPPGPIGLIITGKPKLLSPSRLKGMDMTKKALMALVLITLALTACNESKTKAPLTIKPFTVLPFHDQPKQLASGFRFTEGPAADAQGNVYFTDIPNNKIHIWSLDGTLSTFTSNSGGTNGLFFTPQGSLLACEGGNGRVTSIDLYGNVTVLADNYNGKPFNSPNDLWPDPKGGVYFTDPRYGNRNNLPQDGEHVYYIAPDKTVTRVIDDMVRPNGLIGTPDGKILYVADHGGQKTYRYKINPDATLSEKTLFAESGSDGMTIDTNGNVYLTSSAVKVYNPAGKNIQNLELPERPANVTFAGPDRTTLFATARSSIYAVKTLAKGAY